MKSAREIALEKIAKLGSLSADEIRQQREERVSRMAKALVDKYMAGMTARELVGEIEKSGDAEKPLLGRVIAALLIERIELMNRAVTSRALEILRLLLPSEQSISLMTSISEMMDQYQQAILGIMKKIDEDGRTMLHQLRISGNAIKEVNAVSRREWQQMLAEAVKPFAASLAEAKLRLLADLHS